jgi:hypothetical protein
MSRNVELSGSGVLALAGVVVVAGALFMLGRWLYQRRQALNPASEENIVNQAVGAGVSAVAGRDTTLGGEIADLVFKIRHPLFDINAPTAEKVKPTMPAWETNPYGA